MYNFVDHNARTRIKCDMTTDISCWEVDPPAKSEGGSSLSLSPVGRDNDSQTGLPIHHRVRFSALSPPPFFWRGENDCNERLTVSQLLEYAHTPLLLLLLLSNMGETVSSSWLLTPISFISSQCTSEREELLEDLLERITGSQRFFKTFEIYALQISPFKGWWVYSG